MLESLPGFNSYHKFELPAQNLLPPPPRSAAELVQQISQQLFALCYNVENYINLPQELHLPDADLDPEVWKFFHEVVNLLPRTLEKGDIIEARIDLFETLAFTEPNRPVVVTELINPGADAPEPLVFRGKDRRKNISGIVEVQAVVEGNSHVGSAPFVLSQNALAGNSFTEYIIEFIPDSDQPSEEEGLEKNASLPVESEEPPAKGQGKAKIRPPKKQAVPQKASVAHKKAETQTVTASSHWRTRERKVTAAATRKPDSTAHDDLLPPLAAMKRGKRTNFVDPLVSPESPTPSRNPRSRAPMGDPTSPTPSGSRLRTRAVPIDTVPPPTDKKRRRNEPEVKKDVNEEQNGEVPLRKRLRSSKAL